MAFSSLSEPSWASPAAVLAAIAAAWVAWLVSSTFVSWYRLRAFPGPLLAQFSQLWIVRAMASGQMPAILQREQARHGPIVRIGPNELVIYSADELWRINAVRSAYGRGGWYSTMKIDAAGHSIFSEPDTARHDRRKALLAGGYAGRGNMDLERDVNTEVAVFVDLVRNKYLNGPSTADGGSGTKVCDLAKLVRWYAVDVTTLSGLGEAWGDLEHERDTFDYLRDNDAFSPFIFTVSMASSLRYFFTSDSFLRMAGPKPTDKQGIGKFLGLAKNIVDGRAQEIEKSSSSSRHENMVDTWLRSGLSPWECYLDVGLLLPAGAETTTTAIRGALMYLFATPTVYHKLKDELREGIKQGRISSPITLDEAKKLPYLQAIINESLRMLPPSIIGFPKKVPPQGDTVCGKFVPGGTDIFLNVLAMVRDRSVFGDDADVFRPERFLEGDEEERARLQKHVDLVFGYGRWMCAGKTLAVIEMNKLIVELMRRFDFQLVTPEQPWKARGYVTWMIDDFCVRITEGSVE